MSPLIRPQVTTSEAAAAPWGTRTIRSDYGRIDVYFDRWNHSIWWLRGRSPYHDAASSLHARARGESSPCGALRTSRPASHQWFVFSNTKRVATESHPVTVRQFRELISENKTPLSHEIGVCGAGLFESDLPRNDPSADILGTRPAGGVPGRAGDQSVSKEVE